MKVTETDLLRRIEALILKTQNLAKAAAGAPDREAAAYALTCLDSLTAAVLENKPVFGMEPWHPVREGVPLSRPGEMLLRLRNAKGEPLPPYPAIMVFYGNGMTADIDAVLVLCALNQFKISEERQVSINVSGRSLRDADFIKAVLPKIEAMGLKGDRKVIFEIHESAPNQIMSPRVLDLFRKYDVGFAIDDVGLSMNDIFRLSEFEQIADFIKLDRKSVMAHPDNANSLDRLITLVRSTLPQASLVAEGVKSAQHAMEILSHHPEIDYVQGLYLPDRETFARQWEEVRKAA